MSNEICLNERTFECSKQVNISLLCKGLTVNILGLVSTWLLLDVHLQGLETSTCEVFTYGMFEGTGVRASCRGIVCIVVGTL